MIVISSIHNEKKNAAPKAPADINKILKDTYNAKTTSVVRTGLYKYKILLKFFSIIFSKEVIVLQYPLVFNPNVYKLVPKKKAIILIHDISGLRNQNDEILNKELRIFKQFKYIIVHNDKMKSFLINRGISKEKIYNLELFDYLTSGEAKKKKELKEKKIEVVYPGNLKKEKSPFLYQIDAKMMKYTINLYGLGITKNISDKLIYKGSFETDEIDNIQGDVGLVWDGNYDESDENESYKNYTKYNNPHKLSCCIAIGIPVITWNKSAIADFIDKYNIGYKIKNLYEINNIDFSDYEDKLSNVKELSLKVRRGYFTKKVFEEIIKKMM